MKVLFVFGTRPETIKMAPVIRTLATDPFFSVRVCVTGQHKEMLHQALDFFEISPDYDLEIMKTNQDLFGVTISILERIKPVLAKEKPDLVLIQGDTTTTFSTALAAFYNHIPIGHIEAGLRTNNLSSPFPEEGNRQLVSRLAQFHFAPTAKNKTSLIKEGTEESSIFITGNTVIDSLLWTKEKLSKLPNKQIFYSSPELEKVLDRIENSILITSHRRESFGKGFDQIFSALRQLALSQPYITLIFPVHPNPNVKHHAQKVFKGVKNIHLIPPLDYPSFVYLMSKCRFILTDSGGVQEEAPTFGKPVLVLRETTERIEAIEQGTVKLVGISTQLIIEECERLISDNEYYKSFSLKPNPYGDGTAASRIKNILRTKSDFIHRPISK